MTNKMIDTKAKLATRLRGLIAGTQKHSPNGSLTFGGSTTTVADLVALFQSAIDALSAADAARAAWDVALTKAKAANANALPVAGKYAAYLVSANGSATDVLSDYGLTPRKARAPLSTETRTLAAAKAKATRAARHTMGSVQKKKVKGNVTDVTVTPVVDASPTASPTPPTAPVAGGGSATPHSA